MHIVGTQSLHNGMITGLDIIRNNQIIIPKNVVLSDDSIKHISNLLGDDSSIWVYDLHELHPILMRDAILTKNCVDFLVRQFDILFTTALVDENAFNGLLATLNNYLFQNRNLLYELLVLRDNHCYTYEHSLNVALYSLLIGLNEGLTSNELQILVLGCALHDLGKRNISNKILDKPSKLSDTEFKAIKQHPLYGCELAENISSWNKRIEHIILQHHEKLDGSGYPFNLTYTEIDHLARIATVADIFDAVASHRAYHQGRSISESIDLLNNEVDCNKISKEEVENLVKSLVIYPRNTMVILNNGKSGVVIEDCNTRYPRVMCFDNTLYDLAKDKGLAILKVV